jgi:hypothetical protein
MLGMCVRSRLQQHSIDHAENRRGDSDAKSQSQDACQSEARALAQKTGCVAELPDGYDSAENGGVEWHVSPECLSEPIARQCYEEIGRFNISQVTGCENGNPKSVFNEY